MINRLRNIFGFERKSLANPSPELLSLFGAVPTAAGISVSADTALRSPTTLASCRAISESIGSLPFHLYRRSDDGTRERDNTHSAAAILAGDWCPWAGGVETRTGMQLDALLHGAAYGLIIRANGQAREIHRLDPRCVTRDTTGPEPRFKVQENGVERVLDWRDVLYIPTPGSIGNRLVCLVNLCREAIAIDMAMSEHQGRLFGNGARPSGVLKYGKMVGPDLAKRLRESFNSTHAGAANGGRTMILEDGMSFEPMQFSSVDLQFIDLRRFVIQEIARAFKVPGTLIGDLDRATWRNVEELMRQFVQTCLMPWAEVWQSALERVLLSPEERREYFIEAVFDDMVRGDITARFTAYRQAAGGAWLTRNEIRQLDNRPPVEGGDELILQAGQGDAAPVPQQQEPAPE
ncbi:MAG: phage portal protein [Novosphingobium sp.]|nr:phage portal protein [Novosphingobium sp.]